MQHSEMCFLCHLQMCQEEKALIKHEHHAIRLELFFLQCSAEHISDHNCHLVGGCVEQNILNSLPCPFCKRTGPGVSA